MSSKLFLRKIAPALLVLGAWVPGCGAALAGDPFELQWQALDEGVWVGIRPNSPRSPVVGSTTIVAGEKGVLVYDAAGFVLQGERLVEKLTSLTDKPVTHIVISHWHGDHNLGLAPVLEAFPDAEVIAHEFTAKALQSPLMDYSVYGDEQSQQFKSAVENIVKTDARGDGTPLTPALRAYFTQILEDFEIIDAELRRIEIPVVTQEMSEALDIDLGGRTVQLRHLANGNTKGDVILYLPDARILATGDVMVFPTPYGFGSYPRSWAGVLRQLKGFDARYIVPGHGAIQEDFAYGDLLIETFELVADQVEASVARGKSLDEVREDMDFSSVEDRFTHGDDFLASRFDVWFKRPIVEAEFNLATGEDNESLEPSESE